MLALLDIERGRFRDEATVRGGQRKLFQDRAPHAEAALLRQRRPLAAKLFFKFSQQRFDRRPHRFCFLDVLWPPVLR